MAFGDLLEHVGSTGRFQVLHVTLLSIPVMMMASHNLLQNFVAAVPPHFCSPQVNLSHFMLSPEDSLQITVPQDKRGKPQRCQRYVTPQWHLLAQNGTNRSEEQGDVELQGCKDGWSYNMTDMTSTIISDVGCIFSLFVFSWLFVHHGANNYMLSHCVCVNFFEFFQQWNLVCNMRSLKQMGQTVYMGGVLVGALVFGALSDR